MTVLQRRNFLQRKQERDGLLYTKLQKSLGINVQGEMGSVLKTVFVHCNTKRGGEKTKNKKKERRKKMIIPAGVLF